MSCTACTKHLGLSLQQETSAEGACSKNLQTIAGKMVKRRVEEFVEVSLSVALMHFQPQPVSQRLLPATASVTETPSTVMYYSA